MRVLSACMHAESEMLSGVFLNSLQNGVRQVLLGNLLTSARPYRAKYEAPHRV